jgi:hypothetical protein
MEAVCSYEDYSPENLAVCFSNIDDLLQSIADHTLNNYNYEHLRSYQPLASRLEKSAYYILNNCIC